MLAKHFGGPRIHLKTDKLKLNGLPKSALIAEAKGSLLVKRLSPPLRFLAGDLIDE